MTRLELSKKLDSIVNHENFETFSVSSHIKNILKIFFNKVVLELPGITGTLRGEVALYFDAEKKPALKTFLKIVIQNGSIHSTSFWTI